MAQKPHRLPSKEIWTYLLLSLCSVWVLLKFVNVTPRVDEDFFFSSSDPQLQQEKLLSRLFLRKDSQLIICVQGQIRAPAYAQRIRGFCRRITAVPGVLSVVSITNEKPRTMTSTKAGPFVAKVMKALVKRGCHPKVTRS